MRNAIAVLLLALAPLAAEDNLKYGQPACSGPVLDKKFFVICYDAGRKVPVWVGYALSRRDLANPVADREEGNYAFKADTDVPAADRARRTDYSKSGYDQGHMAPAADFARSVEAMKSTFILTNAVPQRHGVNNGQWKQLEKAVRKLAGDRGDIWIFSGPFFASGQPMRTIGKDRVGVPSHTFKVVLCVHSDGDKEMFAFVMPNLSKLKGGVNDYAYSVNYVERLTKLDFFAALPAEEQRRLERSEARLPQ